MRVEGFNLELNTFLFFFFLLKDESFPLLIPKEEEVDNPIKGTRVGPTINPNQTKTTLKYI
jgi:hypothetical protein